MADVDKVARALCGVDATPAAWPRLGPASLARFRAMAVAAIDALDLTEETRTNVMSSAGQTTNTMTGKTTHHSDMRYDRRLVGPWHQA